MNKICKYDLVTFEYFAIYVNVFYQDTRHSTLYYHTVCISYYTFTFLHKKSPKNNNEYPNTEIYLFYNYFS